MDTQPYYQALNEGNPSPLEELAEKAGYTERFNPLDTRIMGIPSLRYSYKSPNLDDWRLLDLFFEKINWKHRKLHPLLQLKNPKRIGGIREYNARSDWNDRFKDHFTRLRRKDGKIYYTDCWQPVNLDGYYAEASDRIVVMKGEFKENLVGRVGSSLDDESKIVLYLALLRGHSPALSKSEIISGPNWEYIVGRLSRDFAAFFLPYVVGTAVGHPEIGFYTGLAVMPIAELDFVRRLYNGVGDGFYKKQGVRLGKAAIDSIVNEIQAAKS